MSIKQTKLKAMHEEHTHTSYVLFKNETKIVDEKYIML